ncbi:exonuclease [Morganella phage vB_MmoM_MP1]|uniref:Exonuclease A n=1 Tax=Morganella phage vB_MmoM_MP1 TaxID=1852628 RepID=A0A192YC68_9CAUD|nr:exonuclease [Morganella phage vB_MmoM_MP1]ANM46456.1 exonuclease A [Morganella phage vB_MmoM_MP1]
MKVNDFVFDFETFDSIAGSAVVDLSVITFNPDPNVIETFDELVSRGIKIKFNLASQKGVRSFSTGTIEWWKKQSPEAREGLKPSPEDVSTYEGIKTFLAHLKSNHVIPYDSFGYCRGQSFDFPIMVDLIRDMYQKDTGCEDKDIDTFALEPVKFWNQRDIRTAIENRLMVRGMTMTPLKKGLLSGFIKHNSIHDCAKDILMLKYAERYALGLEEAPTGSEIDPLSLMDK